MTTEMSDAEAILTLALVITDMATLINNDVVRKNIVIIANELVCHASDRPLTKDFYISLSNLMALLKQEKQKYNNKNANTTHCY
ncbi:hypothetical protein [Desulforamulus ferrireducens]|uniref:Uncharacterized protein n=1 Tax=Desulforamulus ferrireducens TaxID=1833852 RepID=A0A1S6IU74_9FIRM|nr:hypothetical protein [Desulforamulus ferrireducens]AQS58336.1 hypothetical protein B0537_04050 [Desulforamulus ferrireducens]